jgi:hypothetical protein
MPERRRFRSCRPSASIASAASMVSLGPAEIPWSRSNPTNSTRRSVIVSMACSELRRPDDVTTLHLRHRRPRPLSAFRPRCEWTQGVPIPRSVAAVDIPQQQMSDAHNAYPLRAPNRDRRRIEPLWPPAVPLAWLRDHHRLPQGAPRSAAAVYGRRMPVLRIAYPAGTRMRGKEVRSEWKQPRS